jgi:hypothetical protein
LAETVTVKEAFAAGFDEVRLTCGDGDEEWRDDEGDGDADRECDGVTEGDGDDAGSSEIVGDGDSGSAAPTGTVETDGRTTVGPAADSPDGPTARTATQTTSATRIVTAARKTRRAGLTGVGDCFEEGNDGAFRIRGTADYLITASL